MAMSITALTSEHTRSRKTRPASFHRVHDLISFRQNVAAAKDDGRLAVVYYSAPWCGACKFTAPKLKTLARDLPVHRFYEVSLASSSQAIINVSGVEQLPSVGIYRNGEQVWLGMVDRRSWSAFEHVLRHEAAMLEMAT